MMYIKYSIVLQHLARNGWLRNNTKRRNSSKCFDGMEWRDSCFPGCIQIVFGRPYGKSRGERNEDSVHLHRFTDVNKMRCVTNDGCTVHGKTLYTGMRG